MMMWHGVDLRWAYSDLLPHIRRQISCKQSALDILHDCLVCFALARNPHRTEQPHAFLQIIVRNQLIDEFNYNRRFVSLTTEDGTEDDPIDLLSDRTYAPSVEHLAEIQQRLQAMQSVIDQLPPRCKEAFWLFRIEGLDQSEIARQMGITRNIVQRHISRAMIEFLDAEELIR